MRSSDVRMRRLGQLVIVRDISDHNHALCGAPAVGRGVEVMIRVGNRTMSRLIQPGYSYCCSNDPRAHVGLGPAEQYDEIRVHWPDGTHELFPGGAVDRQVVLRRGQGQLVK